MTYVAENLWVVQSFLSFESHAQQSDAGVDFWLARDLQALLGYAEWRNFERVIAKAKIACEGSAHEVKHHFVDVNKMIELPKGEVEKC